MSRHETSVLHSYIGESFSQLDKEGKLDLLRMFNLSLTTCGALGQESEDVLYQARELGFTPVRFHGLLQGMAWLMHEEHIIMPTERKQKQARGRITEEMLDRMRFEKGDRNQLQIKVTLQDGSQHDILSESERSKKLLTDSVSQLALDPVVLEKVLQRIKSLAKHCTLFAFEENNSGQISIHGPRLLLQRALGANNTHKRSRADSIITTGEPEAIRFGILRETVRQGQIEIRRRELREALARREIIAMPKFKLDNWPADPFMSNIRRQVDVAVDDYIERNNILCDPRDLKYQTLFRLTTHEVAEVFLNGVQLDDYLQTMGAYVNWRNILYLDNQFLQQFNIDPDLLTATIEEQFQVIRQRLQDSKLPIERILTRTGIFAEPGWVIQKRGGAIYAAQEEGVTAIASLVPLEFREVDPEYAKQFHQDLHYIHTPRADVAFGLYIEGDDLPFSVLALEKIDRPYKQNVLLMQGYNPRYCYDLTRLYSRLGTPANTSSSMFSLAFLYMRNHYPETQAVMSAFMPSYATGVSMTSGGFDNPVLIKPLNHVFEERTINGKTFWEHLTKRRQEESHGRRIRSKLPLLPTIELMSPIQNPRYTPFPEIKDFMIEVI